MSWVQAAVSRSNEDIFDEDADEMYLLQKEWNSTMKKRLKEGYRDGVEAGKELALQKGFNEGYRHGAELMITCGQFKGTLNALLSWCRFNGHDSALSKINNLLDVVGKHEEDVLKYLNSTEEQPHLRHVLDSVEDMDLNHTASAGTEHKEVKDGKQEDGGSSGENICRNNDWATEKWGEEWTPEALATELETKLQFTRVCSSTSPSEVRRKPSVKERVGERD
ncbi:protein YAE1 homolog isoform X2 [Pseudopipra pipra]|uniref:protein YAE1 homolog isoform X2 n=1 Tax=Pseudopipra pipra TaxID=415032 RepID=UPI0031394D30